MVKFQQRDLCPKEGKTKMEQRTTEGEQNLLLLQRLIPREEKLYVWCYTNKGEMLASSCPKEYEKIYDQAFRIFGGLEHMLVLMAAPEHDKPHIVGSPLGMQWSVTFQPNRNHDLAFATGPIFGTRPLEEQIRSSFRELPFSRENRLLEKELCRLIPELPVIPHVVFIRYVLMVHNTLTGQQLGLDALIPEGTGGDRAFRTGLEEKRDRNKVYLAEKALLQMVRNGDISYQGALLNSTNLSPGVPVRGKDPLRGVKTSMIVFTSLVVRAAMEGGLSPEIAYPLGDSYIQSVEDSRDSGEMSALCYAMYHDFIYRVHYLNANPNYSHAIRKCCDYIELSLDRKIKVSDLATLVGYSEYYLTEKFKKETGQSLNAYIKNAKVERAKVLLTTTDLDIRDISEKLAFSTVNFFIKSFRDVTGETPAQFRKEHQRAL